MGSYLERILARHRQEAARDRRDPDELVAAARALAATAASRGFTSALAAGPAGPRLIAEVKRRSPSKGDLAANLDPARLAAAYERGGAACLSVLTDAPHFGGSAADLAAARAATALPVLRKDFTLSANDVCDARLMGADAVLLIVAALDDTELRSLRELATSLDLAAIVEVHDETEAARALESGAEIIGVNQRDLRSFELDARRAARIATALPPSVKKVAESGIASHDDVLRLAGAGFDAVLVGESVVTSSDPAAAVRALLTGSAVPCG